jgi:hypothetical protein
MKLSLALFPCALSTLTALTGYFFSPRGLVVATARIASTARGAKKSSSLRRANHVNPRLNAVSWRNTHAARILELIDVFATLTRQSFPSLSTLVDSCSAMNRQASLHANLSNYRIRNQPASNLLVRITMHSVPVTSDDCRWVDLVPHQLVRALEKLRSDQHDRSGPVSYFLVLLGSERHQYPSLS